MSNAFTPSATNRRRWLYAFALVAAGRATAAPPAVQFSHLGDLPGGGYESYAQATSDSGDVVVGRSLGPDGPEAFRWTAATGLVGLGDLPGGAAQSDAFDVSADGVVVVGIGHSSFGTEAFRWTEAGGTVGLGSVSTGPGFLSEAYAVSADGAIAVGRSQYAAVGTLAMRKETALPMFPLPDLTGGASDGVAMAISPDGAFMVGRGHAPVGFEAVRWAGFALPVSLGDLPGGATFAQANDLTPDGAVVVGFGTTAAGTEPFRWTEADGMVSLGTLPGPETMGKAWAVTPDGARVVGWSSATGGTRAFVWEPATGLRSLDEFVSAELGYDLQGWSMVAAYDLSADGLVIVGLARSPGGATEAFRLQLPPDGDFDANGRTDGADIPGFVAACANASTHPTDRRHGDFVRDAAVNADDAPEFVELLLGQP